MKWHFFLISLLAISENLGLKKLCRHDSLWHLTQFLFRFAVNVKGLRLSAGGGGGEGRLNFQRNFQKEGVLDRASTFSVRFSVNVKSLHSVQPPSLSAWGGGAGGVGWGLNFQPNFQKGPQLLERVGGKEGMTYFRGAMQFPHTQKNKIGNI